MEIFKIIIGSIILFQIVPIVFLLFSIIASENRRYFYLLGLKISALAFVVVLMLLVGTSLLGIY
jgi:hypothetical protein